MPPHLQPANFLNSRAIVAQPRITVAAMLAASGCDLGDEREVLRTLRSALPGEDATCLPDHAIELAREIRAASLDLQHS
jgi:hypothetical protein